MCLAWAEERRSRAERAQQQREAWNRLLELRILLQPVFGLANRLPRTQVGGEHDQGPGSGRAGRMHACRG